MARMGMDVDQVEKAGHDLQNRSADIDALINTIEGLVSNLPSIWDGKDAQMFVTQWWPEHKAHLVKVSGSIAGLGRSALANASEQRNVSGH